jgi:hypothetical protein
MAADGAFKPARGKNQKVSATTTSQLITIGAGNFSIRIVNQGTNLGYFVTYKASDETRLCTQNETPIAVSGGAGSVLVIEKPYDHDTLAYLSDSATTVLHFQPGEGAS